jgi:hypothetical protein
MQLTSRRGTKKDSALGRTWVKKRLMLSARLRRVLQERKTPDETVGRVGCPLRIFWSLCTCFVELAFNPMVRPHGLDGVEGKGKFDLRT